MSESDEARWALYYGVKQLAKNTRPDSGGVEAKLFYNFLDEKYGEDEMTFFLFTYVGCVFSWVFLSRMRLVRARWCATAHAVARREHESTTLAVAGTSLNVLLNRCCVVLTRLRTVEGVLPTPIDWGPTVFSSTASHIPEALASVKAPVVDASGREIRRKETVNSSGQPLVPPVLWIGTAGCCCAD